MGLSRSETARSVGVDVVDVSLPGDVQARIGTTLDARVPVGDIFADP